MWANEICSDLALSTTAMWFRFSVSCSAAGLLRIGLRPGRFLKLSVLLRKSSSNSLLDVFVVVGTVAAADWLRVRTLASENVAGFALFGDIL